MIDIDEYLQNTTAHYFLVVVFDGHRSKVWNGGAATYIGDNIRLEVYPIRRDALRAEYLNAYNEVASRNVRDETEILWDVKIVEFSVFESIPKK